MGRFIYQNVEKKSKESFIIEVGPHDLPKKSYLKKKHFFEKIISFLNFLERL